MVGSVWSLLPFVLVLPFALWTRQVLPGLVAGLLAGAYLVHPAWVAGLDAALGYLLKELAVPDNLRLMVFLYGFGALVGLVRVTGGVAGFAQWMGQRVQSWRQAMAVTWLSALVTCMAPDFRIITTGPVARTLFQRLHAPLAPAALAIDITATPLCAVIPVGTAFVGYMISLLSASARHHGSAGTPFAVLLLSIPLNFFAWGMLAYGLWDSFLRSPRATPVNDSWSTHPLAEAGALQRPPVLSADARLRLSAPLARAEWAAEWAGPVPTASRSAGPVATAAEPDPPDPLEAVAERVPPRLANLALPLVSLLGLTLLLTWLDGRAHGASGWDVWAQANAAKAMLDALVVTLLLSLVWYACQRVPAQRLVFGVVAGGNEMMSVIVLLALVWAVSAVSSDLGFAQFVGRVVSRWVPPALLVPALFVFGCAISYVIGSSFGTWGLLLPLGASLAEPAHIPLALIAGAVFASGTFGGFASPLSDNTVAMATVMKLPLLAYAQYKLRPALWVAAGSTLLYALAGWWLMRG